MSVYRFPVTLTYPGAGGPGLNVWHLRTTGDAVPSAGELEGLSNIIRDFYAAQVLWFAQGMTISYQGVATTVGLEPEYDSSAPAWTVTSTSSSGMAPPLLAVCVNWLTTNASRSGRGRTFLGPYTPAAIQADGTVSNGALTDARDAAAALVAASTGSANGAVGVWSPTDQVLRDVVGTATRDRFAVMTSRRD